MRSQVGVVVIAGVAVVCLAAQTCLAEGQGQPDLDKAIQMKLTAQTPIELNAVIDLCQSALDKGLDEGNEDFCKELMCSTLLQRAEVICERLFDSSDALPAQQMAVLWRLALKDVERAIGIDAKQALAQLLLGKLQSVPGADPAKARKALDQAIELAKDDSAIKAEALRLRAGVSESMDERLKDLAEAAKLAPDDPKVLRDRGAVYLAVGRADDALTDFDAALKADPNDAGTHYARGMTLGFLKRNQEARDAFSLAAKLAPSATGPLLQRARISAIMEEFDASVEDAQRALELDPDNIDGLIIKAQALTLANKADQALADANRAVDLKPESDDVLRIWAMVIEKAGKTDHTIEGLRKVVEANPDDAISWLELGLLYAVKKDMPKAIDALSATIKLEPKREFAYHFRADTYLGQGMRKKAIADYERALRHDANNSGVLNNLAWLLATAPEEELRDGDKSLQLATQACEVTHYRQAHILSTLASAYAELGDFTKAREWSKKSIEIADDSMKEQLRKELASYEKEQPWRERQEETKAEK